MPFIDSKVSVKTTSEQRLELKKRLGQAIAILPGKSERWLMVDLADEQEMYMAGNADTPCAYIAVNLFGEADKSDYEKMTAELTKIYGEVLGIAADRMYIKYMGSYDWGWNGSNF